MVITDYFKAPLSNSCSRGACLKQSLIEQSEKISAPASISTIMSFAISSLQLPSLHQKKNNLESSQEYLPLNQSFPEASPISLTVNEFASSYFSRIPNQIDRVLPIPSNCFSANNNEATNGLNDFEAAPFINSNQKFSVKEFVKWLTDDPENNDLPITFPLQNLCYSESFDEHLFRTDDAQQDFSESFDEELFRTNDAQENFPESFDENLVLMDRIQEEPKEQYYNINRFDKRDYNPGLVLTLLQNGIFNKKA